MTQQKYKTKRVDLIEDKINSLKKDTNPLLERYSTVTDKRLDILHSLLTSTNDEDIMAAAQVVKSDLATMNTMLQFNKSSVHTCTVRLVIAEHKCYLDEYRWYFCNPDELRMNF